MSNMRAFFVFLFFAYLEVSGSGYPGGKYESDLMRMEEASALSLPASPCCGSGGRKVGRVSV